MRLTLALTKSLYEETLQIAGRIQQVQLIFVINNVTNSKAYFFQVGVQFCKIDCFRM